MLPRVVWAEESKHGLRFEIGPSYDVVPTMFQCPSDGQSSCMTFFSQIFGKMLVASFLVSGHLMNFLGRL